MSDTSTDLFYIPYPTAGDDIYGTEISISLWFTSSAAGTGTVIVSTTSNNYGSAYISSGKLAYYNNGGAQVYESTQSIVDGTLYHIVIAKNGTSHKFYVNSIFVNALNYMNGTPNDSTVPVRLFCGLDGYEGYGKTGKYEAIRVYDRELTQSQIAAIYNLEKP